jgi:ATP-binding protein involved in chromosome partitioning
MIAKKTLRMFETTKVPILGIIENMSTYLCPHCGKPDDLFGHGTVRKESGRLGIPFLGEIPLDAAIRRGSDAGRPVVVDAPESASGRALRDAARALAARISVRHFETAQEAAGPAQVRRMGPMTGPRLTVTWGDGHESHLPGAWLRRNCPCAACVSEETGRRTLDARSIPDDLAIARCEPVGQYALSISFGDGHATGIYTFETLRRLCPCPACQSRG